MPRTKEAEVYVARSTGVVKIDGLIHRYIAGRTRIRAGHPLLRALPDAFMPMELDYEVEQATAGEKRGDA